MKHSINFPLRGNDATYYRNQLAIFANAMDPAKVMAVQYGKQDIRGAHSITLVDHAHCVPMQLHFASSKELLAYVTGYNAARTGDRFGQYTA